MDWGIATHGPGPSDLDLNRKQLSRGLLQSLKGTKTPISLEGYLRHAETNGFMMFSQSCAAASWIRIPVGRIRELEWIGDEMNAGTNVAHVRLIL